MKIIASKNLLTVILLLLTLTPLIYSAMARESEAHILTPSIQEYILVRGQEVDSSFTFTSEADDSLQITSQAYAYNPKDQKLVDEEPFVTVIDSKTDAEPGKDLEINYKIRIPDNVQLGTYFNVISNEEIGVEAPGNTVGVKGGVGVLIVIHVVESSEGNPLQDQFLNGSALDVVVIQKGFPLLRPTIIQATYQNSSNYVLHPTGEIRIVELYPAKVITSLRFNEDADSVYPGETITQQYQIQTWEITNSLKKMSSIARIQLVEGDTSLEDRVDFSVRNEFFLLILLLTGVICLIALFIASKKKAANQLARGDW